MYRFQKFLGSCGLRFPSQQVIKMTNPNAEVAVHVRIEGKNNTIFDGTISTHGKDVTTNTGTVITRRADGMNGNEYPFKVPTCTSALADTATGVAGRPNWGATFHDDLDDFFVKTINETAGQGEFWQLALNFRRADVGGGQLRVTTGDSVLWALVKGQTLVPLRLKGRPSVKVDTEFTVTVLDGETRKPVPLVTVSPGGGTRTTDVNGQVKIKLTTVRTHLLRADAPGIYVRSNVLKVTDRKSVV